MATTIHLSDIAEVNQLMSLPTRHPLVTVVDFSNMGDSLGEGTRISCDFYILMFKNYSCNKLRYGRKTYDFQDGSLVCVAPRQMLVLDTEVEQREDRLGWGLFFHPDLIRGTPLGANMKQFTFFSYETNEALHLSEKEKQALYDVVQKIDLELSENIDRHSQGLVVSLIELLLGYCSRYYDRQFITRRAAGSDMLAAVEKALGDYFQSEQLREKGLPTVKYLADQVHLSPNYLSDLLKRETGMNARDRIHYHLIEAAKDLLINTDKTVSELAFELGFEYPQYFSRLFKAKAGMTPLAFRNMN